MAGNGFDRGKNRQVRRMTAAVGFPTLRLVRVAIAHLYLDNLKLGQWRDLTPKEIKSLYNLTFPNLSSGKQKGLQIKAQSKGQS